MKDVIFFLIFRDNKKYDCSYQRIYLIILTVYIITNRIWNKTS